MQRAPINESVSLQLLTWKDEEGKSTFWHSSAHLLAEAMEALYPGHQTWVSDLQSTMGFITTLILVTTNFLLQSSRRWKPRCWSWPEREQRPTNALTFLRTDAIAYFKEKEDPYKLDLLDRLEDGSITFYEQGGFTDLCKGPHIPSTGKIKAVKLMLVAGAYWLGDVDSKQLNAGLRRVVP